MSKSKSGRERDTSVTYDLKYHNVETGPTNRLNRLGEMNKLGVKGLNILPRVMMNRIPNNTFHSKSSLLRISTTTRQFSRETLSSGLHITNS